MEIMKKLKKIILSAGIEEYEYQHVSEDINLSNRNTVMIFSSVVLAVLSALYIISFIVSDLEQNRVIYGGFLLPTLMICALSYRFGKEHKKLMMIVTYLFLGVLTGIGIGIGTVLGSTEVTATFIAIMLIAPQLFIDRPWHMYVMILLVIGLFVFMALQYKDPVTWTSDITNTFVFGILSMIVCTYTINIRVSRFGMEKKIRLMAEYDQLTGLRNRNSYEFTLKKTAALESETIYCVYIDVNGLHEMNNTKGHEAGDRMLQYVAKSIICFFDRDDTYRVGGDEFVVIGSNMTYEKVEELLEKVKEHIEAEDYHVAVGVAYGRKEEIDISKLIKIAETKMYEDKDAFYKKKGIYGRKRF